MFKKLLEILTGWRVIKTPLGNRKLVNTSPAACQPYGFFADERFITPGGQSATVQGAGNTFSKNRKELWYKLDNEPKICRYWAPGAGNLRENGFQREEGAE